MKNNKVIRNQVQQQLIKLIHIEKNILLSVNWLPRLAEHEHYISDSNYRYLKDIGDLVGRQPAQSASSDHSFDPSSSPSRRLKWFSKVLCLVDDLPVTELHDAYCWDRSSVIDDHILGDP
jgi:hypothetical protein